MSKFFETLGKVIESNPELEALVTAAERDALKVLSLPTRAVGAVNRASADLLEAGSGVVQSGAKALDKYGPRLRFGEGGSDLKIPAGSIADAAGAAKSYMGDISDSPSVFEQYYDDEISAKDEEIADLLKKEGDFESAASDRIAKAMSIPASIEYMTDRLSKAAKAAARGGAAAGRRAAAGEDMLVEGVPSETPTLEEMQSRNAEFGDSFDFMEGSEDYPAGRAKKSARKVKRRSKRKSKLEGGEPLIATEAGRTIDEIAAPELQVDVSKAAKAEVISEDPEDYTDQAIALFKNTHGTSFDPKSRMDRGKLENMKSLLADMGGMGEMTPNQFALQFYREYP